MLLYCAILVQTMKTGILLSKSINPINLKRSLMVMFSLCLMDDLILADMDENLFCLQPWQHRQFLHLPKSSLHHGLCLSSCSSSMEWARYPTLWQLWSWVHINILPWRYYSNSFTHIWFYKCTHCICWFSSCYSMCIFLPFAGAEILTGNIRVLYSSMGTCLGFAVGYMVLPLSAYYLRDWKSLLLALSVPCLVFVPLWW